jgi:tetratricopeptide (TPR) repeat protein
VARGFGDDFYRSEERVSDMRRTVRPPVPGVNCLAVALLAIVALSSVAPAQEARPLARLVAATGRVEVERAGRLAPARAPQSLEPGDIVRTGADGRAAILLADESQIKVHHNSILEVRAVGPPPVGVVPATARAAGTLLNVTQGLTWGRTRAPNMQIQTPTVSATIRGTELVVQVDADGTTRVAVVEGLADVANPAGRLLVRAGELATARVGAPPTRTVLVRPMNAVQWAFTYPGVTSPRDYPLSGQRGEALARALAEAEAAARARPRDPEAQARLGEALHDLGRWAEAEAAFREALRLAPGDPRAATGLGWVQLQRREHGAALATLRAVTPESEASILGRVLAHYRLRELGEAARALEDGLGRLPRSAALLTHAALFAMLRSEPAEAQAHLAAALAAAPRFAPALALRGLIALTQNDRAAARRDAGAAAEADPGSPTAHLALSLALQGSFDLDGALRSAERAAALDPNEPSAWTQAGRLLFGMERQREAERALERARALAPDDAQAQALLGFLRLAAEDPAGARRAFEAAIAADPMRGEPHVGLGLLLFRERRDEAALEAFLTATLLEPQISLFQSYLGKALAEAGRDERRLRRVARGATPLGAAVAQAGRREREGLAALERAAALDPQDPTPHLYRGIILADLNRAGEAVAALQRAIARNDGRAVFRSRLLLDRDLATRNVGLAKVYRLLGQNERARIAAIRALEADPASSGAHLFFANTLAELGLQGTRATLSELTQTQVLLPVNQNAFAAFNEYTSLFERPRIDATLEGTLDSLETRDGFGLVSGGNNRVAFRASGDLMRTEGFRPVNDDARQASAVVIAKANLAANQDLLLSYTHLGGRQGDLARDQQFFLANDPDRRLRRALDLFLLGYHLRPRPEANLLVAVQGRLLDLATRDPVPLDPSLGPASGLTRRTETKIPFVDAQAVYLHRLGDHRITLGGDFYDGTSALRQEEDLVLFGQPVPLPGSRVRMRQKFAAGYAQDRWRLLPDLTLTGGLRLDYAEDGDPFTKSVLYRTRLNPQAGLTYELTPRQTIRLAAARSLQTHGAGQLIPAHVAGFPLEQALLPVTRIWQYHAAWDGEITPRTFLHASVFRIDREAPAIALDLTRSAREETRRLGAALAWNQLVTDEVGLAVDYLHVRRQDPAERGDDDQVRIRLSYVHPIGLIGRLLATWIRQDLGPAPPPGAPSSFWLLGASLSYEFPNKWGHLTLAVDNLLRQRFHLVSDSLGLTFRDPLTPTFRDFIPDRRYSLRLSLNF